MARRICGSRHFGVARLAGILLASTVMTSPVAGQASQAPDILARIAHEGTARTEIMPTAEYLMDVIGPRLTNSPAIRKAQSWAEAKFRGWGLRNIHTEAFEFGRGWWIEHSSVRMLMPRATDLTAIPIAWTPSTNGTITAPIILAQLDNKSDFAKWQGKLAGKIVLVSDPDAVRPVEPFSRLTAKDLTDLEVIKEPVYDPAASARHIALEAFPAERDAFLKKEGALAFVTMSRNDGKVVHGESFYGFAGAPPPLPGFEMAVEDYRRLIRLAAAGQLPSLALTSVVHFDNSDSQALNLFADVPGRDPSAGYVMGGAHLDSWVAADGATDDGAGVAMVMEAARILARMPRPRRTIRFALWTGEEQGWLGYIAYANRHLATRGNGAPDRSGRPQPLAEWMDQWPIQPRPDRADLVAYFHLDNGSGRIRGLHGGIDPPTALALRRLLAPLAPMGAGTVAADTSYSFAHMVGAPGFDFIQDWNDYGRAYHSSLDTYDHLQAADMRQAAIVLASVLAEAANADRPIPRGSMPTRPNTSAE